MKSILFSLLLAVATAARADLLVSGYSNGVYRYDEITGVQIGANPFIASTGLHPIQQPHRVLVMANGDLLMANAGLNRVMRYNGTSGAYIDDFIPASSGGLTYPVDITIGPDNYLYVSSQGSDQILRYAINGTFDRVFTTVGTGTSTDDGPSGIVFLNGDLFVACRYSQRIYRYDSNGGQVGGVPFASGFGSAAFGLEIGPDNLLYAMTGNSVLRYNPNVSGNATTFISAASSGLNLGIGLDFGPSGLYAASFNDSLVKKYNVDGTSPTTLVPNGGSGSGGLVNPNFLTVRPIPEPGAVALLLAGAVCLARRRFCV